MQFVFEKNDMVAIRSSLVVQRQNNLMAARFPSEKQNKQQRPNGHMWS
jgi:hypothetical protein